jgi:uncharacterized protein (DUF488 family)
VPQEDTLARLTGYRDSLFGAAFLPLRSRKSYESPPQARSVVTATPSALAWILTVGAYGFNEVGFFQALVDARVDTFCDLRRRRGVRGSAYAFANSRRLQERLDALGIRYLYLEEFAPPAEIRALQKEEDSRGGVRKRERVSLADSFRHAYEESRLMGRHPSAFLRQIGERARVVALFCVELEPSACHRSLVADWLARSLGVPVRNLTP